MPPTPAGFEQVRTLPSSPLPVWTRSSTWRERDRSTHRPHVTPRCSSYADAAQRPSRRPSEFGSLAKNSERCPRLRLLRAAEVDATLGQVRLGLGDDPNVPRAARTSSTARGCASRRGSSTARRRGGGEADGRELELEHVDRTEHREVVERDAQPERTSRTSACCSLVNSLRIGRRPGDRLPDLDVAELVPSSSRADEAARHGVDLDPEVGEHRSLRGTSARVHRPELDRCRPACAAIRRTRTTTPASLSARSGVSKKTTWRICASIGSMPARPPPRRFASGTLSFSSTLSAPAIRWSSSVSLLGRGRDGSSRRGRRPDAGIT